MQYIADINVGSKTDVRSLSCHVDDNITLTLKSTDGNEVSVVRLADVKSCLGYGYHEGHCLLVRHNLKTALLMQYVDKFFYGWGSVQPYYDCSDRISLSLWHPCTKEITCGQRRLLINLGDEVANCSGDVFIRETRFVKTQQLFTLYDFLGSACKDSGLNLMGYEMIKIFSPRYEGVVTVMLKQTAEAKRFYTKMFMDVMT